jgi:hypothetical protein
LPAAWQLGKGFQVKNRGFILPWGSAERERSQNRPQGPVPDVGEPAAQNPSMSGWDNRPLKRDVGEKGGSASGRKAGPLGCRLLSFPVPHMASAMYPMVKLPQNPHAMRLSTRG